LTDGTDVFASARSILHRPPPSLRTLIMNMAGISEVAACRGLGQLRRLELAAGLGALRVLVELREHAARFRHLDELVVSGDPVLAADEVDALRTELERALPTTKLDIDWQGLVVQPRTPAEPRERREPTVLDAESRDERGRVNALARFTQHRD
jgi:hypothetical protein